jgi:hypothetical protein
MDGRSFLTGDCIRGAGLRCPRHQRSTCRCKPVQAPRARAHRPEDRGGKIYHGRLSSPQNLADAPLPKIEVMANVPLTTQGDAVVAGLDVDDADYINRQLQEILKPPADIDYMAVRLHPIYI